MTIIEQLKNYVENSRLFSSYVIQPYSWAEKKGSAQTLYLVISPSGQGTNDREFSDEVVRFIFVGYIGMSKMKLRKEVTKLEDYLLNAMPSFENLWDFEIISRPVYLTSIENRPIFELNVMCGEAKYYE